MEKRNANTTPAQGETQRRTPREPHERDESADSQKRDEASMHRIGGLAHDSVERGETDTSKAEATDPTYAKEFRKPAPGASRK
jgi:hypothetical protein